MINRYTLCMMPVYIAMGYLLSVVEAHAKEPSVPFPIRHLGTVSRPESIVPEVKKSSIVVDRNGQQIEMKSKYYPVGHFSQGLIVCAQADGYNYKFGYLDKAGNVVVEPKYSRAKPFSNNVGIVEDRVEMSFGTGEYSLIDEKGKLIKHFSREEVDQMSDFSEGLAVVRHHDSSKKPRVRTGLVLTSQSYEDECRFGFCDTKGSISFFPHLDKLYPLSQGLSVAIVDDKYGFVDKVGKFVIEPSFSWVSSFSEGLAAFSQKGKTGFIDKSGKIVFELSFDRVGAFSEGLAPFQTGGKWGFVDIKGNVTIEPKYAVVADGFHGGVAACAVQQNKLPTTRMEFSQHEHGETPLTQEHETQDPDVPLQAGDFFRPQLRFGLIDKTGKFLSEPGYRNIGKENDGLRMIITTTGGCGFIDRAGKILIEPKYNDACKFAEGAAIVSTGRLPGPNTIEMFVGRDVPYQPSKIVDHTPMRAIQPELLEKDLSACKEACVLEPDNPKLLKQLAWFYFALNKNTEALKIYDKVIALTPKSSERRLERAEVYIRLKRWKDAETDITESIELTRQPDENGVHRMPSSHYALRGLARLKLGNLEGAQSDLLDNYCMGDFKDRKLVSTKGIPNNCVAVLALMEEIKDYDTASILWNRLYHEENFMPPALEYMPTLPQLNEKYKLAEQDLDKVIKENKAHPYLIQRKSFLAAEALSEIILRENARYRSNNLEQQLLRLIELRKNVVVPVPKFEGKPDERGYVSMSFEYSTALEKRVDWGRAKYWLMKYYAEQRDHRCEQIYKELMVDTIDIANWRCTASAVYANYLLDVGRVDEAERVLKFGIEKYPNIQIVRAQYKFLNSKGCKADAKKLMDDFVTKEKVNYGSWLPTAPMPDEDCDVEGFLELAKTCNENGLFNSGLFYLTKAESIAMDDKSKQNVANYRKHFVLLREKIPSETEVKYQRVYDLKAKDYLDPTELSLCVFSFESCKDFLPPFIRSMQILREEGSYKIALDMVSTLSEKVPDSIDVLIEKARLHACLKETKEAKATYEKILSIDPENSAAKREMEILDKPLSSSLQ